MWHASSQNSENNANALLPPSVQEKPRFRGRGLSKKCQKAWMLLNSLQIGPFLKLHLHIYKIDLLIISTCQGFAMFMKWHETTWHTRLCCVYLRNQHDYYFVMKELESTRPWTLTWFVTDLYFATGKSLTLSGSQILHHKEDRRVQAII